MHRFCLRFVECLARRICEMHSSAASLPAFIWKQMNYLLFLSRLSINLTAKNYLVKKFLFKHLMQVVLTHLERRHDGMTLICSLQ